ncbi:MAG TPA: hypothetical protein VG106_03145, partial [Vicinamibacterales bacterium]|nr:hypothetical protein [Vicinamibacterales bacterium]
QVDGRHHLDRDLGGQRYATGQVEHGHAEGGRDLRRQHLQPQQPVEAQQGGQLAAAARQRGIPTLAEVRWAVLETSGSISFVRR